MYVGDWLGRGATYWPDRLAVVDPAKGTGGRFTYRQLNDRANRLAAWLRHGAGVAKGERVAMLARNGVEYLDVFFACGKIGAIFVPYNWRLHPRELSDLAARTEPRLLVYESEFADAADAIVAACPSIRQLVVLGDGGSQVREGYEAVLERTPPTPTSTEDLGAEDIACLLFTGGTTGRPKAAQVSYRMIAWNTLNTIVHELERTDITVTHTPMFHTGGLLVYTLPLLTIGGTVIVMRRWDPDELLGLVERERVTLFFCVPTQYQQLLQVPRFAAADLSSLRFVTSGGAPLPVAVIRAWRAVHDVPFKQGFGMTEFGPGVFSMEPEYAESKAGSIGRPNYFVDARCADDANRPLAPGEVGELVLKGPSMFSGYFRDPEATAAAIDAGGWFHTGDLARVDDDGFFYIVDRKKDLFISGGENVYPVEIEAALAEHPAVQHCAVIGVPDETWGEVGWAFVVLVPGKRATADELVGFLRARLARYKVPKQIAIVERLPLSGTGKVLKDELRLRVRGRR